MAWHRNSPQCSLSIPKQASWTAVAYFNILSFSHTTKQKIRPEQELRWTCRSAANPLGFHLLYNHFRNMKRQIQRAFNFCLLWFQKLLAAFLLSISDLWFLRSASLHFSCLPLLILRRSQSKRNVAVRCRTNSFFSICNAKVGFVRYRNLAQ